MKLKTVRLEDVRPYENNPRRNDGAVDAVAESIRQCGYVAPIVVDEEMVILAGHTRYKALTRLGHTTAKVLIAEGLSEEQKRKYRILDNKTGEIAEWDEDLLNIELEGLDFDGFDFGLLDQIVPPEKPQPEPEAVEDDYDEAPPDVPNAKRGEVYQLGRHRLMCGDAASASDVQTLMGGAHADMVFTDPPYGVAIGSKNKELNAVNHEKRGDRIESEINGDALSEDELYQVLLAAFVNIRKACAPDAVYYVTSPQGGSLCLMMMMMRDAGLPVRHVLMWEKNAPTFSIGRLDYDYQHEPIFYTWTEKHHNFRAGKFRSSVWEVPKPTKSKLHPTMKPVELVANAILDGSQADMIVLDVFGGSGTTLIAAEQLGRRAYMMELDPKYVDVIIDRWEKLTGEKAVRIDGV